MMLDPGCRSGRWISASPVVGPLPIQRRSLQILVRPTAIVRSTPLSSTSESRVPWASKWSRASVNSCPVTVGEPLDDRGREARRRVDAGADRGAAQRQLAHPGEHGRRAARRRSASVAAYPPNSWPSMTGVASIRWVRPDFTTSANSSALARQAVARSTRGRAAGPRRPPSVAATWIAVGKVSLEDWLALTWSLGCTSTPRAALPGRRGPRSRSCSTTCPTRSGRRRSGTRRRGRRRRPRCGRRLDRVGLIVGDHAQRRR